MARLAEPTSGLSARADGSVRMRPLRVVHVLPYYAPAYGFGGPVLAAHALARAQIAAGADVEVIATDRDGAGRLPVAPGAAARFEGVPVRYCRAALRTGAFAFAPDMPAALAKALAAADIAHIHGLYAYPTLAGAAAARRAGRPYVVSPRGMLDPYAIAQKGKLRKRAYLRLVEGRNLRAAALLHFTTHAEHALARQTAPDLAEAPAVVLPNPFVGEPASGLAAGPASWRASWPASWPALAGAPYILYLGRLDRKKGVELLIDAVGRLTGGPGAAARLVVAGDGPADYNAALRRRAAAAGLGDRVLFAGFVSGPAKAALLSGAAVFALPSHSENFGNAVAEAMAAGIPVVVSERVNLADEIVAVRAGRATPLEVGALAAALGDVLAAPAAERAAMGAAGADWARRTLDPAALADKMLAAYEAVLVRGAGEAVR